MLPPDNNMHTCKGQEARCCSSRSSSSSKSSSSSLTATWSQERRACRWVRDAGSHMQHGRLHASGAAHEQLARACVPGSIWVCVCVCVCARPAIKINNCVHHLPYLPSCHGPLMPCYGCGHDCHALTAGGRP